MTGNTTVGISPLPTVYAIGSSGNSYCAGTGGVDINLAGSDAGVNYQLFNGGTAMGTSVSGTGTSLDFGYWLPAGSYSVVATNATTGCVNNMSGSVGIAVNPLPAVYAVVGGGAYCGGTTGVPVGLSRSDVGTMYQLFSAGTPLGGTVAGTGSGISFGAQTAGNYTVVAVNTSTSCTSAMAGSVNVVLNAPPAMFAVTGGGNYCAGGTGADIGLSNSSTGVNYRLYRGSSAVGSPIPGTGAALDFGLQTGGSYTVVASDAVTGCTSTMAAVRRWLSIRLQPLMQ